MSAWKDRKSPVKFKYPTDGTTKKLTKNNDNHINKKINDVEIQLNKLIKKTDNLNYFLKDLKKIIG